MGEIMTPQRRDKQALSDSIHIADYWPTIVVLIAVPIPIISRRRSHQLCTTWFVMFHYLQLPWWKNTTTIISAQALQMLALPFICSGRISFLPCCIWFRSHKPYLYFLFSTFRWQRSLKGYKKCIILSQYSGCWYLRDAYGLCEIGILMSFHETVNES